MDAFGWRMGGDGWGSGWPWASRKWFGSRRQIRPPTTLGVSASESCQRMAREKRPDTRGSRMLA